MFGYNLDIVFCLDTTKKMESGFQIAKKLMLLFPMQFRQEMEERQKNILQIRIRIIAFGKLDHEQKSWYESEFFELPEQQDAFNNAMNDILISEVDGPVNGLEAIQLAIQSDWSQIGSRKRHVIVVVSSDKTLELGSSKSKELSGNDTPWVDNFDELTDLWETSSYMDKTGKRLVLMTPEVQFWSEIGTNWSNVIHYLEEEGSWVAPTQEDLDVIVSVMSSSI
jgi:hypothetical protein